MNPQQAFQQARQAHERGDFATAERLYRQVIALAPDSFAPRHLLGVLRSQQGQPADALQWTDLALKLQPTNVAGLHSRALVLSQLGCGDEALASLDRAIALKPDLFPALHFKGALLRDRGRFDEALATFSQALAVNPGFLEALYDRATTYWFLKRFGQALAGYDAVLARQPNFAEAHASRGLTLWSLRQHEAALIAYDRALALNPNLAFAWSGRGSLLWELGRLDEALASLDRALVLQPNFAEALYNRGNVLLNLNRFAEAADCYERALAAAPNHTFAFGALATAALHLCDWTRMARIAVELPARMENDVIPPLTLLGYSGDGALLRRCAERNMAEKVPVLPPPLCTPQTRYGHAKVRLAYVSSDFGRHPVSFQLVQILERHDRDRFDVHAISTGPDDGSEMRARMMKAFDGFHDLHGISDREAAQRIAALEADIVIDLGGHTRGSRLEILSHRPAPVQAAYLGYPGTTAAPFIDYIIADPVTLPTSDAAFFSEHIVHLPATFFPADNERAISGTPTRAEAGLPENGFVFCCFNRNWKITPPVFDIWMRLLAAVPGSVLWLKSDGPETEARLREEAVARGVAADRIVFAGRVDSEAEHLARHRLADLFLDTLPYNAHATGCDALWAGLPLLACRGSAFAGRVSASLLEAAGLPELIVENLADYEALALALARDPARLAAARAKLADNRVRSPLFDGESLRRALDAAYLRMWRMQEAGESPAPSRCKRQAIL